MLFAVPAMLLSNHSTKNPGNCLSGCAASFPGVLFLLNEPDKLRRCEDKMDPGPATRQLLLGIDNSLSCSQSCDRYSEG